MKTVSRRRPRALVVMATDVGRSPRAARHAQALHDAGCDVTVIGTDGQETFLSATPGVEVVRLRLAPATTSSPDAAPASLGSWLQHSARRFGGFALALHRALMAAWARGPVDLVLVVLPPCVPVVDVVMAHAAARRVPVVVDWHNLEASMVALRLGATRRRGQLARAVFSTHEHLVTRGAALHLAVTPALAAHLAAAGVCDDAVVFPDHPVAFAPRHTDNTLGDDADDGVDDGVDDARRRRGLPTRAEGALVVMSSSFSADDDLDFLGDALARVAATLAARGEALTLLLTGEGPRRREAVERLSLVPSLAVQWRYVDDDDYLATVSCADVALCVHRSASGLDFPLKITDAAAAGVPCVALDVGGVGGEVLRAGLSPWDRAASTPAAFADAVVATIDAPPVVDTAASLTWAEAWVRLVWPALGPLLGPRR